jgi:hypothetical protein
MNPQMTRFSTIRHDNTFKTFSEMLAENYPKYILGERNLLINVSDNEIDINDLKSFLMSKDLDRYEKEKELYFGHKHGLFAKNKAKTA